MNCIGPVSYNDIESQKLFCFNLKTSIKVIGAAGVIFGFLTIVRIILFDFDDPYLSDKPLIIPELQLMVKIFFCLLTLGSMGVNALLVLGIIQNKALYLFAYLGPNVAGTLLSVVLIVTSFFAPLPVVLRILFACMFAGMLALNYYILRKIYAYYLHLRYLELERS